MELNVTEAMQMTPPGKIYMTGLLREPESTRPLVFTFVFVMYALTLIGNTSLVLAILREEELHKPMYIFMSALSMNSIVVSTTALPRIMYDLLSANIISFPACVVQMTFIHITSLLEGYILAAMAADRYMAICKPLHYSSILTSVLAVKICFVLVVISSLMLSGEIVLASLIKLCSKPRIVWMPNCDFMSLTKMSCEDVTINIIYGYVITILSVLVSLGIIVFSYICILYDCQKSTQRRSQQKAISTCVTHFFVLIMFYVFVVFMVMHHRIENSTLIPIAVRSTLSSLYYIIPPVLNPIIYGLRTAEIRQSLVKILKYKISSI
ncbi:olfactory receptor 52D1-like [Lethenteron reissneri]|uniref:olfactory receptor 52D1-like n=1 Tax=Lethenteron reissneri TaxID=7753 RepID=UPI002AB72A43|nr:olfactory receptor 52D1-like [Lethenteron reissneri]